MPSPPTAAPAAPTARARSSATARTARSPAPTRSPASLLPDLPSCDTGIELCDNGAGDAKPWTDGLAFDRKDRLLVTDGLAGRGVLYRVDVDGSGAAGALTQVYATAPGEGPDGFALGASGRI